MALTVLGITCIGVLIAILGWAFPSSQAIPTLHPDHERGFAEDVRTKLLYNIIMIHVCVWYSIVSQLYIKMNSGKTLRQICLPSYTC